MAKLHLERKEPQQAARIMASLQRLYPSLDDKDRSAHQALLNLAIELAKTETEHFSFVQFMDWWGVDTSPMTIGKQARAMVIRCLPAVKR